MKLHIVVIFGAVVVIAFPGSAIPDEQPPSGERYERTLVQKVEKDIATGIGIIWPVKKIPLTKSFGTVFLLDANPAFSQEFLHSLDELPWDEEYGASVSTISIQFDDESGIASFRDSNGNVFWEEWPDNDKPYDANWVNTLYGNDLMARPVNPFLMPSRLVGRFKFVVASDMAMYTRRQRMETQARLLSAPMVIPGVGDAEMRLTEFTTGANVFHFSAEVGSAVAEAYANTDMNLLFSKNLKAPPANWVAITNVPTPAFGVETSFDVAFDNVPGYVFAFPPVHDPTCVPVEVIETPPFGQAYTNYVYVCGHVSTRPSDAGFFRLGINDDGAQFHGITRLWLAQHGLLGAFSLDSSMAFNNVFGADSAGDVFDTGMTYQEFFRNNLNPLLPPAPWAPSERLDLSFRNYSFEAAWTMTVKGMGPSDSSVYILDKTTPGVAEERTLPLCKGNAYEIRMQWKNSKPGYSYNWYTWEARVARGGGSSVYLPETSLLKTYDSYIPIRCPGILETFGGYGYFVDNTDGLMTPQVGMNDNPNHPAGYGGGGNVAGGLKATLYTIKATFITPAGDPTTAPQDSGDGQNQFTYSTDTPGVLTVNLKAKVEPTGVAGKAVDRFRFSVDNVAGSITPKWAPENPNGKPTVSGDYLTATVTFTKIPYLNDSFGWKTAKLSYQGTTVWQVIATNQYGVFFPKDAKNHPICTRTNCADCPNWFYYWKQGGVCGIPTSSVFEPGRPKTYGRVIPQKDSIIRLCDLAPGTNQEFIYRSGSITYPSITTGGNGKGIQCVAETIQHENLHLKIYNDFKSLHNGFDDRDGDWIPNDQEANFADIKTNPDDWDTYRIYSQGASLQWQGDQDIRCFKAEATLPANAIFPKKDWANPGCQHKNQFGPKP